MGAPVLARGWQASQQAFKESSLIARIWPAELIAAADPHFAVRNLINDMLVGPDKQEVNSFEALHVCMSNRWLRDLVIGAYETLEREANAARFPTGE